MLKKVLRELFIFKNCDFDRVFNEFNLKNECKILNFTNGEIIFRYSDTSIFLTLISGKATIFSGATKKSAIIREMSPGESLGVAAIFSPTTDNNKVSTTVISDNNSTFICIPKATLEKVIEHESVCAMNYIRFLASKISFLNSRINAFTLDSAEAKLSVYLESLCSENNICRIPFSYTELASMLNIGRASLYRAFDTLIKAGAIEKTDKNIKIINKFILYSYMKGNI